MSAGEAIMGLIWLGALLLTLVVGGAVLFGSYPVEKGVVALLVAIAIGVLLP